MRCLEMKGTPRTAINKFSQKCFQIKKIDFDLKERLVFLECSSTFALWNKLEILFQIFWRQII